MAEKLPVIIDNRGTQRFYVSVRRAGNSGLDDRVQREREIGLCREFSTTSRRGYYPPWQRR